MTKEKKSRKNLLSTNDEFINLSARSLIYAGEHKQQLYIVGYCIIAVILLVIGGQYYLKNINNKAQEAYNTAYYTIFKDGKVEKSEEGLTKSREHFAKVLADYQMSHVASLTLPQLAHIDFLEKKYDDAASKYEEFLDDASEEPYPSLAMLALSVCLEEKGDYDKAVTTLEKLSSGPDDYFKEHAMLSLARIYRLKNDFTKSNEILNDFVKTFPASSSLPVAKAFITS